jgi:hypothetical protein
MGFLRPDDPPPLGSNRLPGEVHWWVAVIMFFVLAIAVAIPAALVAVIIESLFN